MNKKQNREQELKQKIKQWKETCEIVGDKEIMNSIQVSLKQIAEGRGIPLSQL
jgi:hypothetical protein